VIPHRLSWFAVEPVRARPLHWPALLMKQLFELVRRNWLFFLLVTAAALALRLVFVFRFPHLAGDTWIYGDIAKNWLNHGIFGITDNGTIRPTLIRLPGYPGFLAGM